MSKNEHSTKNGGSAVRVLRFPATSPVPPANDVNSDALADSIRKAWTQKSSPAKHESGRTTLRFLRLADSKT
jgi:hypothetical protein